MHKLSATGTAFGFTQNRQALNFGTFVLNPAEVVDGVVMCKACRQLRNLCPKLFVVPQHKACHAASHEHPKHVWESNCVSLLTTFRDSGPFLIGQDPWNTVLWGRMMPMSANGAKNKVKVHQQTTPLELKLRESSFPLLSCFYIYIILFAYFNLLFSFHIYLCCDCFLSSGIPSI